LQEYLDKLYGQLRMDFLGVANENGGCSIGIEYDLQDLAKLIFCSYYEYEHGYYGKAVIADFLFKKGSKDSFIIIIDNKEYNKKIKDIKGFLSFKKEDLLTNFPLAIDVFMSLPRRFFMDFNNDDDYMTRLRVSMDGVISKRTVKIDGGKLIN